MIIHQMLFKRSTKGVPQQWQIFTHGNLFWTEAGQVGGVITKSAPTACSGKNIGRANETSPRAQARAEAIAKHEKKIASGYFLSMDDIDNKPPFFKPMLANVYEKSKHKIKWAEGVIVQPKLDGIRAIITKNGATTRNGKEHKAIPHILRALAPLFEYDPDLILDGEIYNHNLHDDFNKISSVVRKQKPTAKDLAESARLAQFHCYDTPHIGNLDMMDSFIDRYELLKDALHGLDGCIQLVPNMIAVDERTIKDCHDILVEHGYEGAIIRAANAPYVCKRSDFLLKYKVFNDDEFIIENVSHGKGLKLNMAATVHCTSKSGQGFEATIKAPHALLKQMLLHKDEYVGKTCTVRYFGLTPDKEIPRFPYMIDTDRWTYE